MYVPAGNGPSGNPAGTLLGDGDAVEDGGAVLGDDAGLADGLGTDPMLPSPGSRRSPTNATNATAAAATANFVKLFISPNLRAGHGARRWGVAGS